MLLPPTPLDAPLHVSNVDDEVEKGHESSALLSAEQAALI